MIFDTHAHYDDRQFENDRYSLLDSMKEAGIGTIVNNAADLESVETSLELAHRYDFVYAAVGVHPENVYELDDSKLLWLRDKSHDPKAVAIGEIGLDYRYEGRDAQREVFISQLRTAKEYSLPVCIHCVRAWGDMMSILREHRPAGVMHGFSGSAEILHEVLALGLYVGFNGSSTNPGNKKALAAIKEVPLDRLLLETDCPYSVPKGAAAARCDSSLIGFTAEYIAEQKGIPPQVIMDTSDKNAYKLFDLKGERP